MNTVTKFMITLALLCAAIAAQAQSALTLTPTAGHPSGTVTLAGSNFGDLEAVDVYVDTVDTLLLVTTATGSFSTSVTIPAAESPGEHYITAIGRDSGDAAQIAVNVTTAWAELGFGAAHLSRNPYENVLSPANVSMLGPLWDVSNNPAGGTPTIVGGRAFVGTGSGIQALSSATGALQWRALPGREFYASPAVAAGVVYVGDGNGPNFYALSATTGKLKWARAIGGGVQSSAVVVGQVVYFGCFDDKVYALSTVNGKVLWTYTTGGFIDSSPAVVNGVVYIGSTDDSLYALNAATGALIWSYKTGSSVESPPAVSNGVVYVGSDDDNIYAINAKGPNKGSPLWTYTTGGAAYSGPAIANDTVYVGSSDGKLYAINSRNGALQWDFATAGVVGSAVVANGMVYVTSRDGGLYALDAASGESLAYFTTGYTFVGQPAVSDGVLYLSTFGNDTYAFSLDAGADAVVAAGKQRPLLRSLHPDPNLRVTQ